MALANPNDTYNRLLNELQERQRQEIERMQNARHAEYLNSLAQQSPLSYAFGAFGLHTFRDGAIIKVDPPKPLPEDHLVNAITACRAWNVPLFADELRSVAQKARWLPYEKFKAQCESAQCSGVSCACGIYAFKTMDLVQEQYKSEDRSKRYVWGECWLWGRVLECKDGYRAQFAYPKAFVNNGAIAKRMSEVFGVELLKV